MFTPSFESFSAGLADVRSYLRANVAARNLTYGTPFDLGEAAAEISTHFDDAPSAVSWRVSDHCASVSRAYAVYERFCERLLGDWLSELTAGKAFKELPEKVQKSYKEGFSDMLRMIEQDRFNHLSLGRLVNDFNDALSGRSCNLSPEVIVHHERNLRFLELSDLFGRVGISGLKEWVEGSRCMKNHFAEKARTFDLTESRLSDLIQYRNDASHGVTSVDEILGHEELEQFLDFLLAFGQCLFELCLSEWVQDQIERENTSVAGQVTKIYSDNIVIVAFEPGELNVGDTVIARHRTSCQLCRVESIKLQDESRDSIVVGSTTLLGLQLNASVPMRSDLLIIDP